jgi:tripartite-type tricarboxylate transporter receptor subunit TctC
MAMPMLREATSKSGRDAARAALAVLTFAAAALASAQDFPSKPITIYVGNPPGGVSDWQARVFGEQLSKRLGQPVVVENRPGGGGGAMALLAVKQRPADGHALMTTTNVSGMSALFIKDAVVEAGKDFAPITSVFWVPNVIITNSKTPAKNFRELIDYARANPGKLNWAAVPNTAIYLDSMELIRRLGLNTQIVPYQGGAPAQRAILANEAQIYMAGGVFGLDQLIREGQITALAVTSARPFPGMPNVPTIRTAAGLDTDLKVHYGFAATAGTPKPVLERLARELGEIANKSELSEQIRKRGYEPDTMTPDQFQQVIVDEFRRAKSIAEAAGIKPQ